MINEGKKFYYELGLNKLLVHNSKRYKTHYVYNRRVYCFSAQDLPFGKRN